MVNFYAVQGILSKIKKSHFAKSILKVLSGTVVAQSLAIFSLPILTRIYSADNFGTFGVCVALEGIAKVIFSCRYDYAIPTAKDGDEAKLLLWLTMLLSWLFCFISYIIIACFELSFFNKFGGFKYLIPLIFLFSSFDNVLSLYVNREKFFWLFSSSRIIRSLSIALFQIFIGYLLKIKGGLILGYFAGEAVTVFFIVICLRYKNVDFGKFSIKSLIAVSKKYCDNPIYLLPGHAINMGVSRLPIIIIESFFGPASAGLLYMGQKIISLPSQLVGSAAFGVYFPEAARQYNKTGSCYRLAKKTVIGSLIIFLIFYLFIDIISYYWIGFFLGPQWEKAKITIFVFSVIEIIPSIFHPISGTWFITNSQRINLKYQLSRSVIIIAGLLFGIFIGGYYMTLISYGLFRSVAFLMFLLKSLDLSKGK